jgi:RimJ/RimL family protein N-acetyltransferase
VEDADGFVLTGPRVRLRPLRAEDVPSLARQGQAGFGSSTDLSDEEARLRRMVAAQPSLDEDGFWSLGVEHDQALVGDIQARAPRYSFPPGVCEIGITLRADVRGRGLGTDAVRLLTAHLHELGWPRVQASTAVSNASMRRVLERCGYGYEGVLRSFAPDDGDDGGAGRGGRADYVLYASVAPDETAGIRSVTSSGFGG